MKQRYLCILFVLLFGSTGCLSEKEYGVRVTMGKTDPPATHHALKIQTQDGRIISFELPKDPNPKVLKTLNMILTDIELDYTEALEHQAQYHVRELNHSTLILSLFLVLGIMVLCCGTIIIVAWCRKGGTQ